MADALPVQPDCCKLNGAAEPEEEKVEPPEYETV